MKRTKRQNKQTKGTKRKEIGGPHTEKRMTRRQFCIGRAPFLSFWEKMHFDRGVAIFYPVRRRRRRSRCISNAAFFCIRIVKQGRAVQPQPQQTQPHTATKPQKKKKREAERSQYNEAREKASKQEKSTSLREGKRTWLYPSSCSFLFLSLASFCTSFLLPRLTSSFQRE